LPSRFDASIRAVYANNVKERARVILNRFYDLPLVEQVEKLNEGLAPLKASARTNFVVWGKAVMLYDFQGKPIPGTGGRWLITSLGGSEHQSRAHLLIAGRIESMLELHPPVSRKMRGRVWRLKLMPGVVDVLFGRLRRLREP